MRFSNQTPLHAAMVPNAEEDDRVTALFISAITYRITRGRLEVAPEQRPLLLGGADLPYPHDAMFNKEAVSVCATGFVYPKEGRARVATAILRVGTYDVPITVFGQRVWQKSVLSGELVPTSPLAFERVAMSWENAYGGMTAEPARVVEVNGEESFLPQSEGGYPLNFNGKGFYPDEARALGNPLPQLEHPEQLLQRWDDRPEPVCFAPYPLWGGLRAVHVLRGQRLNMVGGGKRSPRDSRQAAGAIVPGASSALFGARASEGLVSFDVPRSPVAVKEIERQALDMSGVGKIGNRSAPRTTFEAIEPGTSIALLGMRPAGGLLEFEMPRAPVAVEIEVGSRAEQLLPALDAVDIDAEAAEVRLVYRVSVTYDLVQFELRRARLTPTDDFPEGSARDSSVSSASKSR